MTVQLLVNFKRDCVYLYERMLYCLHVWMAPGKLSCILNGSPSLNKVFELKSCVNSGVSNDS